MLPSRLVVILKNVCPIGIIPKNINSMVTEQQGKIGSVSWVVTVAVPAAALLLLYVRAELGGLGAR